MILRTGEKQIAFGIEFYLGERPLMTYSFVGSIHRPEEISHECNLAAGLVSGRNSFS